MNSVEEPPHQAWFQLDFHLLEVFMRLNRLHFESEGLMLEQNVSEVISEKYSFHLEPL